MRQWDRTAGLLALGAGLAFWAATHRAAGETVDENLVGAGLRASLEQLAKIDEDARKAFGPAAVKTSRSVLQLGDMDFVTFETAGGDIVSRQYVGGVWSPRAPVTAGAPRRDGERWDMPSLVAGPDDSVWIAYRSEARRRVFLHRWWGESWGPRIEGAAFSMSVPRQAVSSTKNIARLPVSLWKARESATRSKCGSPVATTHRLFASSRSRWPF